MKRLPHSGPPHFVALCQGPQLSRLSRLSCRGLSRHVLLGLSNPVASVRSRQVLSWRVRSCLFSSRQVSSVSPCHVRSFPVQSRPVLSVLSCHFVPSLSPSRLVPSCHVLAVWSRSFPSVLVISGLCRSRPSRHFASFLLSSRHSGLGISRLVRHVLSGRFRSRQSRLVPTRQDRLVILMG